MFCESCGAKLKDGAKFCGGCGTKVSSAPINDVVTSINLTPLSAGWGNCGLQITSVSAEGPDSDGDFRNIEISYEISNQMEVDWDHLSVSVQLLSAAGQVVEENRDTVEQTICAGETETLQATMYGLKARTLGASPEMAHVIISVVGSCLLQQSLGKISIPAIAYEPVALKPVKLGGAVQMIAGSLWRTEPGDDKEAQIEIKALVQNLTNMHLSEVKLSASVTDKSGRELTDAGGYDEVRPANICVIGGSGWVKDKKLVGAIAELSIRAFVPIAAGFAQHCGVQITSAAQSDEQNEVEGRIPWPFEGQSESSETDDSDGDSDSASSGERTILVRFAMTKGEGELPQFSELPQAKQTLDYVVSFMEFSPSFDDVEGNIVAWKIVDSGLGHLTFDKNGLQGYPTPTVEFTVSNVDDDDFLRGVWESSYRLEIPELNEGDAYYFEDHNGNAQIVETSSSTQSSLQRSLYANMKWFSPAEQPREINHLPAEFLAAKKLWDSNKNENVNAIIELLGEYVGARFIASNINNWEELFADPEGEGLIEIESSTVKVVGIDFDSSPIPLCKAEATFRVNVTKEFSSFDFENWQEDNGRFTDAVTFYWNIPETPAIEGLDFTAGDNSGVECIVLDEAYSEDSMALQDLVDKLVSDFKADPRNKIFVSEEMLVASATEETGKKVSAAKLRKAIAAYLSGDMDDEFQAIYDGAVYACGLSVRHCFNDDPDDDIDYEVDWQEQEDGSYIAEVRPS
jgi:hypothetical protein